MPFSAERLKLARQRADLSQAQLGQRLGVVAQQVAKWEQQVSVPSSDTLARIGQILGCTTDLLLDALAPHTVPNSRQLTTR